MHKIIIKTALHIHLLVLIEQGLIEILLSMGAYLQTYLSFFISSHAGSLTAFLCLAVGSPRRRRSTPQEVHAVPQRSSRRPSFDSRCQSFDGFTQPRLDRPSPAFARRFPPILKPAAAANHSPSVACSRARWYSSVRLSLPPFFLSPASLDSRGAVRHQEGGVGGYGGEVRGGEIRPTGFCDGCVREGALRVADARFPCIRVLWKERESVCYIL